MTFRRVGDGLPGLLARWVHDPEARLAIVRDTWDRVVGDDVRRRAEPTGLDGETLRVEVREAAWRSALEETSEELVRRLNGALGAKVIRRIEWS